MILDASGRRIRRTVGFLREYRAYLGDDIASGGHACGHEHVDTQDDIDLIELCEKPDPESNDHDQ